MGSSIRSWLKGLLWEAPTGPEAGGLRVLVCLGEAAPDAEVAGFDAALRVHDGESTVALLRRLAALGTTSEAHVRLPDDLPPSERRRIDRAGRALRAEGLWVSLSSPGAEP